VKKAEQGDDDRLSYYAGFVVAIGAAGLFGAAFLAKTPEARLGAFVGVATSLFAGLVALSLKRMALKKSLQWALAMIGVSFGVRAVLVLVGLFGVLAKQGSVMGYILGFFSVYFALQWVEVSYVLDAQKRQGRGS
jgi:hypothetical protein